jgi:hypothetical protein
MHPHSRPVVAQDPVGEPTASDRGAAPPPDSERSFVIAQLESAADRALPRT